MTSLNRKTGASGRDKRLNPRFPKSRVWGEEERIEHRATRDRIIADAGLRPDREVPEGKAAKDGVVKGQNTG